MRAEGRLSWTTVKFNTSPCVSCGKPVVVTTRRRREFVVEPFEGGNWKLTVACVPYQAKPGEYRMHHCRGKRRKQMGFRLD